MEYINGTYCISYRELIDGGIVTQGNYKNWLRRDRVIKVNEGKGLGNRAMIAVDSLPEPYRNKAKEVYGGKEAQLRAWIRSNYTVDHEATNYFFDFEKCGVELKDDRAREYVTNASVLNTCIRLYDDAKARRRLMGEKYDWSMMATVIETLRAEFNHTLPTSVQRFQKRVSEYRSKGYASLMSGKFGNQNTRKVNIKVEQLILSLAIQMNRPWHKDVHRYYNQFVNGELAVWDYESGEMINREDYRDRKGNPSSSARPRYRPISTAQRTRSCSRTGSTATRPSCTRPCRTCTATGRNSHCRRYRLTTVTSRASSRTRNRGPRHTTPTTWQATAA